MTMETKYIYKNPIYQACHDLKIVNRVRELCGMDKLISKEECSMKKFSCRVIGCEEKIMRKDLGDVWEFPFCEEHEKKDITYCSCCEGFIERNPEIENDLCFDCTADCID